MAPERSRAKGHDVHGQPDQADDEDRTSRDLAVLPEAGDRLIEDVAGDTEQQDRVGERGQDLQPVQPEGPLRIGPGGGGGVDGSQCHAQPSASVAMWPASDRSDSEPVTRPTTTCTTRKPRISAKAMKSGRWWRARPRGGRTVSV